MPSTIYNEGRVVGYSAYEIYVRHVLSEDPSHTPASELEWLSSSIAMGSSMLLKIPAEPDTVSGHHIIKVILPDHSNLVAANTIIGSLFLGEAECDARGWATKVTSYGPLISNDANHSPYRGRHSNAVTEYPASLSVPLSTDYQNSILNYIKIVDGIIIQPGDWENTPQGDIPAKDFSPKFDMSNNGSIPYVKLYLSDRVTEDFYILLTGFTINGVINGVSGLDGSTDTTTNMHGNGGFLGPAVFPWANKIIFSVPPAYANYFLDARYTRAIQNKRTSQRPESFGNPASVRTVSVIDMESGNPNAYYQNSGSEYIRYDLLPSEPDDWADKCTRYYEYNSTTQEYDSVAAGTTWTQDPPYYQKVSPCIGVDVTDCNKTTGDSILTVYQRNDVLPPALYASKVSATGEYELNPVDTIAPGTVKLYENDANRAKAKALEDEIPGNYALMRDTSDYVVKELDDNQNAIPVAETSVVNLDANNSHLAKGVQNVTGKKTSTTISMTDGDGQAYSVVESGSSTLAPESGNIHWQTLLEALAGNEAIDIFSTTRFLDEFYRAAKARLLKGGGISFTDDDNAKTRTISANIGAGPGISITPLLNGSIEISNTAMYPGAASGYATLQSQVDNPDAPDYIVGFYGAFNSYISTASDPDEIKGPHIRVQILPVFDSQGNLSQCYVAISGDRTYDQDTPNAKTYHIGCRDFTSNSFKFRHGNTLTSADGLKSMILYIQFQNKQFTFKNHTFSLARIHDLNWSVNPTTSGIWNTAIKPSSTTPSAGLRNAYSVNCNINDVNVTAASEPTFHFTGKGLILNAVSINDGFNKQYEELVARESAIRVLVNGATYAYSVSDLWANWLNINESGVFYR